MITEMTKCDPVLTRDQVAILPDSLIESMSEVELIHVITLGKIPFIDESRLGGHDQIILRRLAYLARQTCQQST
ncbi:MAG: hypothetical protein KDA78_00605 [Planctomycetaceae bacterium]|nr:hypothetical protein [Planctomycetaceae bacterium]